MRHTLAASVLWFLLFTQPTQAQSCNEWVSIPTPAKPAPRIFPGMAYDSVRNVSVLFGGTPCDPEFCSPFGDTWEYDGFSWVQKATAGPAARVGHSMAFDSARGVAVLFGGQVVQGDGSKVYSGETWEWNGTNWNLRSINGPSPRVGCGMAYDQARGVVVLFGGRIDTAQSTGETWGWDGQNWTLISTTGPSPRSGCSMAYDPQHQKTMLCGGSNTSGPGSVTRFNELWQWDGSDWSLLDTNAPNDSSGLVFDTARGKLIAYGTAQLSGVSGTYACEWDGTTWTVSGIRGSWYYFGMVYDQARAVMVGFGGDAGGPALDVTGEWDGTNWRHQGNNFPTISGPGMAYDRTAGVILAVTREYTSTWTYNGVGWRCMYPAMMPPARSFPAMAHDSERGVTVLWGGNTTDTRTWEWNGTTWQGKEIPGPTPAPYWAMTFDSNRKLIVLFGNGLWEYNGSAWTTRTEPGPIGRTYSAIAYDPVRGKTVLFGGARSKGTCYGDTWEWDGNAWEQINVSGPSPRAGHSMVWDEARRAIVVLGGSNGIMLSEVWSFDGVSWTRQPDMPAPRFNVATAYDAGRNTTVLLGVSDTPAILERRPDTDDDGVVDPCDACPATLRHAPVDAAGCLLAIPGDFDADGDIDGVDLDHFAACATGPMVGPPSPQCDNADFDRDQDVDQSDFGRFQRCISGENVAGRLNCDS